MINIVGWAESTSFLYVLFCSRWKPSLPFLLQKRRGHASSSKANQYIINHNMEIYCKGSLLHHVQSSNMFHDSKHFVDMPMKVDPEIILTRWKEFIGDKDTVDYGSLYQFVQDNFDDPGSELESFIPLDYHDNNEIFSGLNVDYNVWAKHIHSLWPLLTRRVKDEVHMNSNRYSLIALPYHFVVPGGRFRELYYWDSFFTIKGLLVSRMYSTVKGMILNMKYLIERFGFVPNGNRIYYLNRSQPPLITWCVRDYFMSTGDIELLRELLPTLQRELDFFDSNRSIILEGSTVPLYRFKVTVDGPRPESYREDIETATVIDHEDRNRFYGDMAAAAESGRDFSSRWSRHDPSSFKLHQTCTQDVLPVDLNSIMCSNLSIMGDFYAIIGDEKNSIECKERWRLLKEEIHKIFWSEDDNMWFDYDLIQKKLMTRFYDSHLLPLYAECAHDGMDITRVVEYLNKTGMLSYPGGIPSSIFHSGEQWDFPNAWAPTMWIGIQGLKKYGSEKTAEFLADKWMKKNFNQWRSSGGKMFEKYDVRSECGRDSATGGEYEVQEGFGWSNGVILDLLISFPHLAPTIDRCSCCEDQKENCHIIAVPA